MSVSFSAPNQYFLDKLVTLSEKQTVTAADDIYDDRGFKLWAKGVAVSRELQSKLVLRKLAKPLESSLTVEHAVSFAEIIDDCLAKLGEEPLLQKISGVRSARQLLGEARTLKIPRPLRLLLTSVKLNDARAYEHTLWVVAICAGIAAELKAFTNDATNLLMAAVLHDIGESNINPEYFNTPRRLAPQEWKHVVSHPLIAQALVQDLTSLPAAVAQCVGQHHERHDGSGYPYQSRRADQHSLAGWIAVADVAASLLASGSKGASSSLALAMRVVPDEFDRDAAGVVSRAVRGTEDEFDVEGRGDCVADAREVMDRIESVRRALAEVAQTTRLAFVRQTCIGAEALLHTLTKSMRATGVLEAAMLGEGINDLQLMAERCLIVREVEWRMRNLGRNIYLRAESQPSPEPLAQLAGSIEMIDRSAA